MKLRRILPRQSTVHRALVTNHQSPLAPARRRRLQALFPRHRSLCHRLRLLLPPRRLMVPTTIRTQPMGIGSEKRRERNKYVGNDECMLIRTSERRIY